MAQPRIDNQCNAVRSEPCRNRAFMPRKGFRFSRAGSSNRMKFDGVKSSTGDGSPCGETPAVKRKLNVETSHFHR